MSLQFDAPTHTYRVNGRKVPSVTKYTDEELTDNEEYELAHAEQRMNEARAINQGRY